MKRLLAILFLVALPIPPAAAHRMASGVTDEYIYFVAVDTTDHLTRETGLSSFTVYYSINGGAATAMTTPTVNETDGTNMPGCYELLIDESGMTTLAAGDDTSELCLHITHASMDPVTRVVEIYRAKITAGNTLDVDGGGMLVRNVGVGAITAPALKDLFDTDSTTTFGSAVAGSVVAEIANNVNLVKLAGSATPVTNLMTVYNTQWSNVWDPNNYWRTVLKAVSKSAGLVGLSSGNTLQVDASGYAKVSAGTGTGQLSLSSGAVTVGTNNDKTGYSLSSPQTFDLTGSITGSLSGSVGSVTGAVGSLADAGASLTAVPWNASWDTEVESEANDALVALHLDHLLATTYDPASKPGAADALFNEIIESDGGVSRFTANALEQAPSGGGGLTSDDVKNAVRYELEKAIDADPNTGSIAERVKTMDDTGVTVTTNSDKSGYALTSAYDAAKTAYTPTSTVDGVTVQSMYECLLAWMAGRATVVDQGNTRVISFYKRNGSSMKFSVTVSELDGGSRAGTGTINP